MLLLQPRQDVAPCTFTEIVDEIRYFVFQGKQLGLLTCEEREIDISCFLETILPEKGQYISLNVSEFGESSLPEVLIAALDQTFHERSRIYSPFINRAILWQRLCDQLIEDDENHRSSLVVFENFDRANSKMQHDFTRLLRFHQTHRIRRSFLLTVSRLDSLSREIRELTDIQLNIRHVV